SILKAAIAKPLSQSTFDQLTRLAERDQPAAAEAGADVIRRLTNSGYMHDGQPDSSLIQLSNQVVDHYINASNQNPINTSVARLWFDGGVVRDIANKVITAYLSNPNIRGYMSADNLIRYAEKLAPGYVDELKRYKTEQKNQNSGVDAEYNKLMQSD